jgi:hypothetical protein
LVGILGDTLTGCGGSIHLGSDSVVYQPNPLDLAFRPVRPGIAVKDGIHVEYRHGNYPA